MCTSDLDASAGDDASAADATADAATGDTVPPPADGSSGVVGVELMSRLAGLWSGSATGTPLGDFPLLNMDLRAADGHVLFGRVDLDATDSLRFALSIETFNGADVLVFRNGGYFMGVLRDSRTALQSYDASTDTYRFCSVDMGCNYIDARFTFTAADQMHLDVSVMMAHHLTWTAHRAETRTLPAPFPVDQTSQGPGTAPFPTLPQMTATVTWSPALSAPAQVVLVLSTTPCGLTGTGCTSSRSMFAAAPAGATSASLTIDQFLPGPYSANVVLDRNNDFATTLRPDSGDGVATPDTAVTVAPTGVTSATLPIVYTLP